MPTPLVAVKVAPFFAARICGGSCYTDSTSLFCFDLGLVLHVGVGTVHGVYTHITYCVQCFNHYLADTARGRKYRRWATLQRYRQISQSQA